MVRFRGYIVVFTVKKWTKSSAVGSKGFADLYGGYFGAKNNDMGLITPILGQWDNLTRPQHK